jgi:hypothetical protein
VRLCRVNQKWVTEVNSTGLPYRKRLWPRRGHVQLVGQFLERHTAVSRRFEDSRDIQMGSDAYVRWRIMLAYVREQEEH